MNVQTALEWCDQVITEVDLALHQWQEDLDMMSFIGQEIPLVYCADGEEQEIGKARLRLTHDGSTLVTDVWLNEENVDHPVKINPAESYSLGWDLGPPPRVVMKPKPITMEETSEFLVKKLRQSILERSERRKTVRENLPVAHFKVDQDGRIKQFVEKVDRVHPQNDPGVGIDWDIRNNIPLKNNPAWSKIIENHPFFQKKE